MGNLNLSMICGNAFTKLKFKTTTKRKIKLIQAIIIKVKQFSLYDHRYHRDHFYIINQMM